MQCLFGACPSHPFLQSDYTHLVAAGSLIRSVADADQAGVRIAVPVGDQSVNASVDPLPPARRATATTRDPKWAGRMRVARWFNNPMAIAD
jgi:hypothetical protein